MKRTFIALALLFASTALAVSLQTLPKSDPIQTVVADIALEWSDGNISTGTSAVSAALITGAAPATNDGWRALAVELFDAEFQKQTGQKVSATAKMRTSSAAFEDKFIERAVSAVAEGNAYNTSNPATMKGITAQTESMISSLGHERDIHFLAVKSYMMDKSSGEKRCVRLHAFINVKTGKMVQIFTIEGTM
ncbi:hypothetical protein BH10BDE1_BH10BDE1_17530 [soil metagenome]